MTMLIQRFSEERKKEPPNEIVASDELFTVNTPPARSGGGSQVNRERLHLSGVLKGSWSLEVTKDCPVPGYNTIRR